MNSSIIQPILKGLAKKIIKKYNPEIIGITGSLGKTSAKEAIYAVLADKFSVRASKKNYNNEIGVPLSIIDAEAQGKNILGWTGVFLKGRKLLANEDKNYPKILILEMGADKPGDIEYLLNMVKCKIGVITRIAESHLEFFGTVEKIKKEKSLIVKELEKSDWAIMNFDDERIKEIAKEVKANYLSLAINNEADIRAIEINLNCNFSRPASLKLDKGDFGISFKLSHKGSAVPVFLPGVISLPAVYAALAGAAAGIIHEMNMVEISQALRKFKSPNGRLNLIGGVKDTLIIDDSYNSSSPDSCYEALSVLAKVEIAKKARRFAVLGDMLELGNYTEEGHKKVGEAVVKNKIDYLIAVGERSRDIIEGALAQGMNEDKTVHFSNLKDAGLFLQEKIKKGDVILVKGSQGMRMEKIVKEVMADPLKAGELLVRQGEGWK